ncbi:MAG: ATP-binding protein, partial [Oscillospiraceae bacterium]|nr:ATP-binding protein [Oscillospiraceae bacterium]
MDRQKTGSRISARIRNMDIILLVAVLTLIIITVAVIGSGITNRASENLAFFYSVETVDKFSSHVSRDLVLVQKVARSKAVTNWFADEEDLLKREAAYNEMMDYIGLLSNTELYFGINKSRNEFSVVEGVTLEHFMPFDVLDPDDPYNSWYYDLVASENEYAFNIDVDKVTDEWRLWINHKVESDNEVVGVFCSGLRIKTLLSSMFKRYDEENVKGFVIDKQGMIRLDSAFDENSAEEEARSIFEASEDPAFNDVIGSYLSNIDGYFSPEAQPEVIKLSKGHYGYASIAPITNTDWLVITFFNSNSLFSSANLFSLVFILTAVFVMYILVSTITVRRVVLMPLNNLTASVSQTSREETEIIGSARGDEIGELARTIQDSWNHIREARERARIILDATPLGCTLLDENYNCIDCNDEAVTLFKVGSKLEYMEKFFDFSPEYQPDGSLSLVKTRELINRAFETGRCSADWLHQLPDGTLIPAEVTLVRVRHGDGHVVAGFTRDMREYIQMTQDIEQRDVLLNAVHEATTLLLQVEADEFENALWHSMGIMAGAVDADRVRLWKNHMEDGKLFCTQLYEWSEGAEPTVGSEITVNASYEEDFPTWGDKLSRGECINSLTRDMSEMEQMRLRPQGIKSILLVPVFIREEFWGFVGFNDCHRERLFTMNEESILRSGSMLIANALLRNDMTQQLASALEKTRAASQAKGNFLSNMSHEIRTPINAIVGMTMIGKTTPDTGKKDYAFERIEVASAHLLGVINDVLDMSKIEANKFELSNVEFDLEKLLQKIINVIVFRVNEKGQTLTISLDPKIPHRLIGDDQRLAQVITNLLSNAVKFTPEQGSISLSLRLNGEENGVCTIQVEVSDAGIGISPEQQKRLFVSFEQAESSTSRKFGGTGLGLAISKQIVELMNGEIWVNSQLGEG